MDDDEAFLYGDDAPETIEDSGQSSAAPSVQAAVIPPTLPNAPPKIALPVLPSFAADLDQAPQSTQVPQSAPLPHQSLPTSLPPPTLESQPTQIIQVPPIHPVTPEFLQESSPPLQVKGMVGPEAEDDDEGDDGQGQVEESDDDLDIILEGDTSHISTAPPSRLPTQPPRFETPRDPPPLARPIETLNATTEYKPLERADLKLAEPVPVQPFKPSLIAMPHHSSSPRHPPPLDSHNRIPTPENFTVSVTPPPQPPVGVELPNVQTDNPVVLSGYDDKDGSALMDFDFDVLPESEKGWKKPGAHLADWFNYGFDETTWRLYVMKQKKMRREEGWAANPFAAFAMGNLEQAWEGLSPELKDVMVQVIMGNSSGPRSNNPPQMPPSMPPMMVMNPIMQGMEMRGFGMQGMSNMLGGGNPPMNGGHNNPGMNSQLNEGPSRVIKQDSGGNSEQAGDTSALYGDELDPREQRQHEQQRLQDQMRHMQHMHHMGMGAGFMPGMDLAAMFGNQDHSMFMNGPGFNGMMDMPQMSHMQHIPSPMQQQINQGPPMNMPMNPNSNPPSSSSAVNSGLAAQTVRNDSPGTLPPVSTSTTGPANHIATSTPGDSPRSIAVSSPMSGRGRGGRVGRGRGNAQASAFLAAAAARGRGRVITASNSVTPIVPAHTSSTPSPKLEAPTQVSPAPVTTPTPPVSAGLPVVEPAATERPSVRPVSPLPSNVPTGPRRAQPVANGPPVRGPRSSSGGYFDKDAAGARGDEGLDYGGGGPESPRDERKSVSRRHSHRSDREKIEEDTRTFERPDDAPERSRSKSRDKEIEEKESSHKSSKSRHRHRARSRSKDTEYRSSRDKSEKDKEDINHKSSKATNGGRRSRRSKRGGEGEDKEEDRDPYEVGEDRDKEKVKEKERDRDRDKERDKDKDRDRDRDRDKDRDKDKERDREKEKERDDDEHAEGDHSTSAVSGSRKRKSREERSSRSKRERAE